MGRPLLLSFASLLPLVAGVSHANPVASPQPPPHASADTLAAPPVLPNVSRAPHVVEVSLTAAPTRMLLHPSRRSIVLRRSAPA